MIPKLKEIMYSSANVALSDWEVAPPTKYHSRWDTRRISTDISISSMKRNCTNIKKVTKPNVGYQKLSFTEALISTSFNSKRTYSHTKFRKGRPVCFGHNNFAVLLHFKFVFIESIFSKIVPSPIAYTAFTSYSWSHSTLKKVFIMFVTCINIFCLLKTQTYLVV